MKRDLIVFQCCKRKDGVERFPNEGFNMAARLPTTKGIIADAVRAFTEQGVIDAAAAPTTALSLYNGRFYTVPGLRQFVADEVKEGPTDFLIISAGYGLVHPFQRIRRYDQRMTGRVTRFWLEAGLPKALGEFIATGGYERCYGFFSKSADYLKIFEAIPWSTLSGLKEGGYFYLSGLRGAGNVLATSAQLMMYLVRQRFGRRPERFDGADVVFRKTAST